MFVEVYSSLKSENTHYADNCEAYVIVLITKRSRIRKFSNLDKPMCIVTCASFRHSSYNNARVSLKPTNFKYSFAALKYEKWVNTDRLDWNKHARTL